MHSVTTHSIWMYVNCKDRSLFLVYFITWHFVRFNWRPHSSHESEYYMRPRNASQGYIRKIFHCYDSLRPLYTAFEEPIVYILMLWNTSSHPFNRKMMKVILIHSECPRYHSSARVRNFIISYDWKRHGALQFTQISTVQIDNSSLRSFGMLHLFRRKQNWRSMGEIE